MTGGEYRELRKRLGTQAQVAAALGIARSTVARREAGRLRISIEAEMAIKGLTTIELHCANLEW